MGLYERIYSTISFFFFLCVCVCPASSSRWMGRYRLYLILFLSLAACFWVIEWNNKGGPFSKCTKFPWTVELADYILLSWFLFRSERRKKIIFNSFKLHFGIFVGQMRDFFVAVFCLNWMEMFPRSHSRIHNAIVLAISPCVPCSIPTFFMCLSLPSFLRSPFCFLCLFYDSFSTIAPLRGLRKSLVHCKRTYGSSHRLGH